MDFKIYKDSVTASECICDTKAELPVESEILLPDYLPPVFKIVKCIITLTVLGKQVVSDKIAAEGYLRCSVLYQSQEEKSLCLTEQKIPFSKQFDIRQEERGPATVNISGETEYVNCRAVNQHRIDIRGAFVLSAKATAVSEHEIVTAVQGDGIQQKTRTLKGICLAGDYEKLFTADEQISFSAHPEMILMTQCTGRIHETKLISGKVILKGDILADVLYRSQTGYDLLHEECRIPFNEIIDAEGADESCICFAVAESAGCTITSSDEDGTFSVSATMLLQARMYRAAEYVAVSDAFSTRDASELAMQKVRIDKIEDEFSVDIQASACGRLPDENVRILEAFAVPSLPEPIEQEGKTLLRGRVTAHILCVNALDEIDCYDKTCEYTLPQCYDCPSEEIAAESSVAVKSISVRKSGDEASADIALSVHGMIIRRAEETVLGDMQCTGPIDTENDNVALRIYYAGAGEELFDIAKRYAVSPNAISAANDLSEECLDEPCRLLIPSKI